MKYSIESEVLFDSDRNTLTHIETEECISITMSQSVLLELIINSDSEILSRNEIIDLIWRNHGINSSGNTLTQYVSLLRRIFAQFGLNEVLVTLPRVGIKLNPEIRIIEIADSNIVQEIHDDSKLTVAHRFHLRNPRVVVRFCYISALLVISISLASLISKYHNHGTDDKSFTYIKEGECTIGLTKNFAADDYSSISKQINIILKDNELVCSNERILFFGFSKSVSGKYYGRAMLAFCVKGENGRIISCENYFYRNWRVE